MPTYRTPGVYFEWLDARDRAISPLRTDIAGFVGIAERGPLHRPVKIESWTQFVSAFGGHIPQAYLAYAVEGFFANGGRTCWVVRVANPNQAASATLTLKHGRDTQAANDTSGVSVLRLTAACSIPTPRLAPRYSNEAELKIEPEIERADPGLWGQMIRVVVIHSVGKRFSLDLSLPSGAREFWRDLSLDEHDARFVEKLLNDSISGSRLVSAKRVFPSDKAPLPDAGAYYLTGGSDGLETLWTEHFTGVRATVTGDVSRSSHIWGLAALALIDEVSIVAIPDIMAKPFMPIDQPSGQELDCRVRDEETTEQMPEPVAPTAINSRRPWPRAFSPNEVLYLQHELIAHCVLLKDRFAVLDPRLEDVSQQAVMEWRSNFDSMYAALYYPWLMVPDPLRLEGLLRAVPPSGHIAGIYARGDNATGVHKPPANERLEGVLDIATSYVGRLYATSAQRQAPPEVLGVIDDIAHGVLNEQQINVIRAYPGRGLRVMGARTLSSDPIWRYVNVRRLMIMIEEAIDERTQWIVFEPNNPDLWREVARVLRNFLDELWQQGMLDGDTAEEAYEIACDSGTNSPNEVELGRVICEIRLLPPWPAEFVIVRMGRIDDRVGITR